LRDDPTITETVSLHAESPAIGRRATAGTTVKVQTVTQHHRLAVDESLFRENVEVSRVSINREIAVVPAVSEMDDLIIIPVVEEELVITRRLILKEEIHLKRVTTVVRHQEIVTLRAQEAVITREASAGSSQPTTPDPNTGET
jgi:stress response protein YsnF